ncbi:hypothetical protein DdX_06405 [Ditylenchus destructor]|uniref:Uncharacterized protein n=1 Tax=Ditylenchus destructor TaxID=166010 RepID=A0AAD4R934_9BILA|nr:hypothetical protein DdX_06405 [Ditylenchus destructor]
MESDGGQHQREEQQIQAVTRYRSVSTGSNGSWSIVDEQGREQGEEFDVATEREWDDSQEDQQNCVQMDEIHFDQILQCHQNSTENPSDLMSVHSTNSSGNNVSFDQPIDIVETHSGEHSEDSDFILTDQAVPSSPCSDNDAESNSSQHSMENVVMTESMRRETDIPEDGVGSQIERSLSLVSDISSAEEVLPDDAEECRNDEDPCTTVTDMSEDESLGSSELENEIQDDLQHHEYVSEDEERQLAEESETDEEDGLCIVDEQEIISDNSAARHFIEPTRVTATLDQLAEKGEPLINRLLDSIFGGFNGRNEDSRKLLNLLLISLIVSAFGGVAIHQILQRSWMRDTTSGTSVVSLVRQPNVAVGPGEHGPWKGDRSKVALHGEPPVPSETIIHSKEPQSLPGLPDCNGRVSSDKLNHEMPRPQRDINSQFYQAGLFDEEPDYRSNIPSENHQNQPVPPPKHLSTKVRLSQASTSVKTERKCEQSKIPFVHEEELNQCKSDLEQTKTAYESKAKILHYVRFKEMEQQVLVNELRNQLAAAQQKISALSRVSSDKMLAMSKSESLKEKDTNIQRQKVDNEPPIEEPSVCFAEQTEHILTNFTKTLRDKTTVFIHTINSLANTTSLSKFVQNTGKLSVKGLCHMSSWLRNQTRLIKEQSFVLKTQQQLRQMFQSSWDEMPKLNVFNSVPKLMDSILYDDWQSRVQSLVQSVGTALTPVIEHNFNFDLSDEDDKQELSSTSSSQETTTDEPIPSTESESCPHNSDEDSDNGTTSTSESPIPPPSLVIAQPKSALSAVMVQKQLSLIPPPEHRRPKPRPPQLTPPPSTRHNSNFLCDRSFHLAEALKTVDEFSETIGLKDANKYIAYLVNVPRKQCQNNSTILLCEQCWWTGKCFQQKQCPVRRWQRDRKIVAAEFLNKYSGKLKSSFDKLNWEFPALVDERIAPERETTEMPLPCDNPLLEPSKQAPKEVDVDSGVEEEHLGWTPPDWLLKRMAARQKLRNKQREQIVLLEEDRRNWLLSRAKHRHEKRQQHKRAESDSSEEDENDEFSPEQEEKLVKKLLKTRRWSPSPYGFKWAKRNGWKADADWLLTRAKLRENLRKVRENVKSKVDFGWDKYAADSDEDWIEV